MQPYSLFFIYNKEYHSEKNEIDIAKFNLFSVGMVLI